MRNGERKEPYYHPSHPVIRLELALRHMLMCAGGLAFGVGAAWLLASVVGW